MKISKVKKKKKSTFRAGLFCCKGKPIGNENRGDAEPTARGCTPLGRDLKARRDRRQCRQPPPAHQSGLDLPRGRSQRKCQINAAVCPAAAVGGGEEGSERAPALAPSPGTAAAVRAAVAELSRLFQGNKNNDAFAKSSSSSGQPEGRRRPPPGPKRFRAAAASTPAPGRR